MQISFNLRSYQGRPDPMLRLVTVNVLVHADPYQMQHTCAMTRAAQGKGPVSYRSCSATSREHDMCRALSGSRKTSGVGPDINAVWHAHQEDARGAAALQGSSAGHGPRQRRRRAARVRGVGVRPCAQPASPRAEQLRQHRGGRRGWLHRRRRAAGLVSRLVLQPASRRARFRKALFTSS